MPYLDLNDHDNFVHLMQLYQAAHPALQAINATCREETGLADTYFSSPEDLLDMAAWGRKRHLITKASARRLAEVAERQLTYADPARWVTLTPRILGTPPRLQPSVRMSEVHGFLYRQAPETDLESEMICTIEAALGVLPELLDKLREEGEPESVLTQGEKLIEWLEAQA